jgi:hypothetical protein
MRYTICHSGTGKYWSGNGWTYDPFLIHWDKEQKACQQLADAMNLARCQFDHKAAQQPEAQIVYVIDEKGNRVDPPAWIGDPNFAQREGNVL